MKRRRRIALISIHGYVEAKPVLGKTDTGGQVTYVLELAKALAKRGVFVDIITRQFENLPSVERVRPRVRIIRFPAGPPTLVLKEELHPYLEEIAERFVVWVKEHDLRYVALNGHYWDGGIVAARASQLLKVPVIWTPHSIGPWKRKMLMGQGMSPTEAEHRFKFKARSAAEREVIDAATRILVLSEQQRTELGSAYHSAQPKLTVIPPGVNVRKFAPSKGEYDQLTVLPEDMIFSVSRIAQNKRLDLLIEAFAYAVKRRPSLYLIIGGGSSDPKGEETVERKALRKLVMKLGVRNHVLFVGYIPDHFLPVYYRTAKFFILSSLYEPFGLTGFEAMACKTPTILSKYTGVAEYVRPDVDALVIDPTDTQAFGKAILRLADDDEFRTQLAESAYARLTNEFTWEAIAKRFLQLTNQQ